jgi:hypothetical protein
MSQKYSTELKASTGFMAKESKGSLMKTNWWKILVSVLIAVLVDVILHRLFAPRIEYNFPPSIFVEQGLFLPAAGVALIFLFGVVAIVFAVTQENMSGIIIMKGWRYGMAFGVLCFVSIIEMSLIFGSSLLDELRTAATDGVSLLLLGLLLAWLTGTNGQSTQGRTKLSWIIFILIPLFFLGGRYFGHAVVHTMSAYLEKPGATFFWTLGIGMWLGVMYWLLQDERNDVSAMAQAIRFGFLVFGGFWLIYNMFVLVFVQVSILDLFVRVFIDITSVTVSIWIAKTLEQRNIIKV